MIDVLIGAFAVLGVRADNIVKILDEKRDVPASAMEHCRRVSERTKGVIDLISKRQDILNQLKEGLEKKQIISSQSNALLNLKIQL